MIYALVLLVVFVLGFLLGAAGMRRSLQPKGGERARLNPPPPPPPDPVVAYLDRQRLETVKAFVEAGITVPELAMYPINRREDAFEHHREAFSALTVAYRAYRDKKPNDAAAKLVRLTGDPRWN